VGASSKRFLYGFAPLEVQSVPAKLADIERELVEESREHSWVWRGDSILGRLVGRDV
jgi:hypothetical protein